MKIRYFRYLIFSITLSVFLGSCDKTTTEPNPQPVVLVSAALVHDYTKEQFLASLGSQASDYALFIRGGVKQYKIIYKTKNTDGTEIQASGALVVPVISNLTTPLPLASYQHGTIFSDNDAPSYYDSAGEGTIASVLATFGYIVAAPDYIGYGSTNKLPHTYEHREGLATASLDLLRAVKEFIKQENIKWNNNVYLGGYSEGGFATLALQKKIEEEAPTEFNLKASSCGAGAYNKTLSFKTLASVDSDGDPTHNASYIWVLLTYDSIYKLNRAMSSYFIEPYASQIQKDKQNARITVSFNKIISDAIKQGLANGSDAALINAVKDNDIFDWKPKTPTMLTHGTADTYVPYFNTQTAYDAMVKRGATNVKLNTVNNGTHSSSVEKYLLDTITFFATNQ
ncbi:S9 family peptidase [Emticicia sp. BO119]|uniref:alpha/beta hydrolase family protein n=1 Tax=Emticicia sp. BO119 TaxID=2757768 RepID=UPI0015F08F4A|nr:lipase family protein [Emticicia sp. BO119]MBA4849837.1 prolyl oligopeptidase family serine peptidase [Emticicia sp. BO119]